jgi:hypothetical protein
MDNGLSLVEGDGVKVSPSNNIRVAQLNFEDPAKIQPGMDDFYNLMAESAEPIKRVISVVVLPLAVVKGQGMVNLGGHPQMTYVFTFFITYEV